MIFTVHQRFALGHENSRALAADPDTIAIIPESKAPMALLFAPFWLAWQGLWGWLFVYLILAATIFAALLTPLWPVALVVGSFPSLYLWLEGHQLRRNRLESIGYEMTDVIEAPSESVAFARLVTPHVEMAAADAASNETAQS